MDVLLVILVVFGAWYIALPLALICAWVFPVYAELVFLGFLHDALFGMGRGLGLAGYYGLITAASLYAVVSFFKVTVRK